MEVSSSILTNTHWNNFPAWSAPSAIGTAGLGGESLSIFLVIHNNHAVGGQLGAEMTDFLVVLNSKSVRVHEP